MKIIIFGVGRFYQEKKYRISSEIEIVAFLDNNVKLQGQKMDGHPIVAPNEVIKLCYEKIILMSASEKEMKGQLLELGIKMEDIWDWEHFNSEMNCGTFKLYCGNDEINSGKKILIISTHLDYTGAPIAALYAAKALQGKGHAVFLAAPAGDKVFIEEATKSGLNIVLCSALPYLYKEELFWIKQFDVVLVNVFSMVLCAYEISRIKPVVWWIHEADEVYKNTLDQFGKYASIECLKSMNIYAVSRIAQKNFNFNFFNRIEKILHYGIPDQGKKPVLSKKTDCLVFAIIGTVCPRKAQNIFLDAIKLLKREEKKDTQFWIIGYMGMDEYCNQVKEQIFKEPAVKMKGLLTRREINKAFEKIDVVVCPSLDDPLPIVVTEGMMYGKTCIVSDGTGAADYIKDEESGFICKKGNSTDLYEKMRWIIRNREKLHTIGNKARQIYEDYFTLEVFGEKLENVLEEAIKS